MTIYFLKKLSEYRDLWDLRDLICMASSKVGSDFKLSGIKFHNCGPLSEIVSVPKFTVFLVEVESFSSGPLDLTKKLEQFLETSGPSGPYMYGCLVFKKICLNLGTFGTFGTSYVSLYI